MRGSRSCVLGPDQADQLQDLRIDRSLQGRILLARVLFMAVTHTGQQTGRHSYPSSHLLPPCVVAVIVAVGEDVVLAGLEAGTVIVPWRARVGRADGIDVGPQLRRRRDEVVGGHSGNGP